MHTNLSDAYSTFWNWFSQHERTFYRAVKKHTRIEEDFFDQLSPALNTIKQGLFFQAGMLDDQTAELEISAEGVIENIVFVEELVRAAPALPGWKFTALKSASDVQNFTIKMSDYEFNSSTIQFYTIEDTHYPDEINLMMVHEKLTEDNKETIQNGVLIFLDNYLGELALATIVDQIKIVAPHDAQQALIPVEKLTDFLLWRQKEFVEKYEGWRHSTDNDNYASFEAELANGNMLIAVMDTDLLAWDSKASHPWIMVVIVAYNGEHSNGMPDEETYGLLNQLEDNILVELHDQKGYLNIGRQTADGSREIYFACHDFRLPSKIIYQIQEEYKDILDVTYEIYKDKYWQSFERFQTS